MDKHPARRRGTYLAAASQGMSVYVTFFLAHGLQGSACHPRHSPSLTPDSAGPPSSGQEDGRTLEIDSGASTQWVAFLHPLIRSSRPEQSRLPKGHRAIGRTLAPNLVGECAVTSTDGLKTNLIPSLEIRDWVPESALHALPSGPVRRAYGHALWSPLLPKVRSSPVFSVHAWFLLYATEGV